MCVIIVKPAHVAMPSYEFLKKAYEANPHGCGFCSPRINYKSMNFSGFLNMLDKVRDDEPCIMHFRIATHGSIRKGNCHPFYDHNTKTWFAHNGILSIKAQKDMTDSETAFRTLLVPMIANYGFHSKQLDNAIYAILGSSKFALMQGREIRLFGHFFQHEGLYLSNLHFLGREEFHQYFQNKYPWAC